MDGYIYFIAAETMSAVKIGFTRSHPSARLRSLQTGSPAPLKLLTFVSGSIEEEQALHRAFRPLHIHGEWFRHELKLRDFIFYLDGPRGRAASRSDFESAIADVLPSISTFYPAASDCELDYVESAVGFPFRGSE